jgi:hypothetical protein
MPYTHGLDTALFWSGVAYLAFRFLPIVPEARRPRAATVMAAVVFSHWLLDLIVHRPDLPLVDNAYKVGLALYDYPLPGFVLESLLLVGGMWLYLRATMARTPVGRHGPVVFGAVLLLINVFTEPSGGGDFQRGELLRARRDSAVARSEASSARSGCPADDEARVVGEHG